MSVSLARVYLIINVLQFSTRFITPNFSKLHLSKKVDSYYKNSPTFPTYHQSFFADRQCNTDLFKMYKLVVLSALFAVAFAAPKPGHLAAAAPLAYAAPAVALPAAVSHQSRVDVYSKPVVTAYAAAPAVAAYSAPAVAAYSAPAIAAYSAPAVALPAAVSHQSRVDYVSKPLVAAYAAPAAYAAYAAPAAYAAAPAPLAYAGHYGYAAPAAW